METPYGVQAVTLRHPSSDKTTEILKAELPSHFVHAFNTSRWSGQGKMRVFIPGFEIPVSSLYQGRKRVAPVKIRDSYAIIDPIHRLLQERMKDAVYVGMKSRHGANPALIEGSVGFFPEGMEREAPMQVSSDDSGSISQLDEGLSRNPDFLATTTLQEEANRLFNKMQLPVVSQRLTNRPGYLRLFALDFQSGMTDYLIIRDATDIIMPYWS